MKPGRGALRLLLFTEVVILAAVIVFSIAEKLRTPQSERASQSATVEVLQTEPDKPEPTENALDSEMPEEQSEPEYTAEVEEMLAAMTLEEKVAQMFLTTPESLTQSDQVNIAGERTRNAINEYPVGGLIYADINYQGREQAGNLMFNAQQISSERIGLSLFLAVRIETEGGTPVIGIADNYEPDAIVEVLATRRLDGSEGISLPTAVPTQQAEVTPDAAWVMLEDTADASVTGEEGMPCALSAQCVQSLRSAGYDGVILTDSLSAENIQNTYSVGDAAVLAIQAGVDMVYCPENFPDAYQAVLDAAYAGEITEEQINQAVGHILTQKYQMPERITDNGQ